MSQKHEEKWIKYFNEKDIVPQAKEEYKSSKGYRLVVDHFAGKKGKWGVTRGTIYTPENKPIEVVHRNFDVFPFAFVESHPSNHDYLICGEDYQGQSVIDLTAGERKDYLSSQAKDGFAFCWGQIYPSPDGRTLAVYGCVWACPWVLKFYDFSSPLVKIDEISLSLSDYIDIENAEEYAREIEPVKWISNDEIESPVMLIKDEKLDKYAHEIENYFYKYPKNKKTQEIWLIRFKLSGELVLKKKLGIIEY